MKKINDLKAERSEIVSRMEEIANGESLTEEQRAAWTENDEKVKSIDAEIAMLERQEILNQNKVKPMENPTEQKPLGVQFRDFLNAAQNGGPTSFRVEPMMSTDNTDLNNKTVAAPDLLTAPGEAFLRSLGITFYTGLNGQLVLPRMSQQNAEFISEGTCDGDASLNFGDITLAPRRVTAYQTVTREFLAQTNPAIYNTLLQELINGLWGAVTYDVFDTLESDGATQITTTGTTATYQDILNMEASTGAWNLANLAYVTTPTGKAFFKGLDIGSDGIKYAWDGGEMNGYPTFGVPAANANKVYFGDWSKSVVGQWGGIEIIVDPYSYATCGKIRLTVLGLFDTALANPPAFAILDASLS